MAKQTPFQKFEALAQQLVEGTFQRFFGSGVTLPDIATALAKVVENKVAGGQVPARYEIRLNPADFDQLRQDEPDPVAQLTSYLQKLVQQAELSLASRPHITLLADPEIPPRELQVAALDGARPSSQAITKILSSPGTADGLEADIASLDAYLIVDGQRHVPLTKPLTSLGRHIDNDIVLDAPTVSRKHAQIRWRYGRFILYDLSNRGRTLVNNQPVSEMVLQSGDVISLSSVKLIYGEGETQQRPRPRPISLPDDETQIRPPTK